jgi:2-deoxy-D-gluconate 3-dehydrogenase
MILDLFKLTDRTALVTGARRGLGRGIAVGLAEAGADIACVSRSGEADETRKKVEAAGRRFLDIQLDLADPGARVGLIERVTDELGSVDILVNNAGGGGREAAETFPMEIWRQQLEVHLTASFDLSQQCAPGMLERGRGKIINIGSVMTFQGGVDIPAYAAAKHAIAGMTRALAGSWAPRGINVNCICPGYFDTDLPAVLKEDPVRGPEILARIPMGRWGQPEELAGLAVFLASDASNYMHGSVIPIDGGWLAG